MVKVNTEISIETRIMSVKEEGDKITIELLKPQFKSWFQKVMEELEKFVSNRNVVIVNIKKWDEIKDETC
jgi:hypothetical protein